MRAKRIFLLRHAQSLGNVDRKAHGVIPDWKIPITEIGQNQARITGEKLAAKLRNNHLGVYVSPYVRTQQTWEIVKKSLDEAKISIFFEKYDPRLREQEWGNLKVHDQRSWEDIEKERDAYGSFFYRFAHGESGADVYDRCTDFLSTLYRDFEKDNMPENVIIVTHGYLLRVLLTRWFHWPVEEFETLKNPYNAEFFELNLDENTKKYKLVEPFPKKKL